VCAVYCVGDDWVMAMETAEAKVRLMVRGSGAGREDGRVGGKRVLVVVVLMQVVLVRAALVVVLVSSAHLPPSAAFVEPLPP
jgi:hypothetical protein